MTDSPQSELENAQHLQFALIASLWREREGQPFVSRQDLHDEIAPPLTDEEEPETLLQLAHGGIDVALDQFAKTEPDEATFHRLWRDFQEPPRYWRHQVERRGGVGYATLENLTPKEVTAVAHRLQRESEEAMREGNALRQWARCNMRTN